MQENFFQQLPHPALEIHNGTVTALNAAAQAQLPSLVQGAPVPEFLTLQPGQDTGSFTQGTDTFLFTRIPAPSGDLVFFRPAQSCDLNERQLEGFSRQMRDTMGSLLNQLQSLSLQVQDQPGPAAQVTQLNHSFHQMLRLMNNLEFLNVPLEQAQSLFRPVSMDLAGLCANIKRQAAPLLRQSNVNLEFSSPCAGLLIPGDPELLQRMVLALISNAAKVSSGGTVLLSLRPWMDRAVLSVADCGQGESDPAALLAGEALHDIPQPGDGAGMGLAVVRRIAALHGATLLTRQRDQGGLVFTVSLPTKPLPAQLDLATPKVEQDAGISPFLLELADFLPAGLFEPDMD